MLSRKPLGRWTGAVAVGQANKNKTETAWDWFRCHSNCTPCETHAQKLKQQTTINKQPWSHVSPKRLTWKYAISLSKMNIYGNLLVVDHSLPSKYISFQLNYPLWHLNILNDLFSAPWRRCWQRCHWSWSTLQSPRCHEIATSCGPHKSNVTMLDDIYIFFKPVHGFISNLKPGAGRNHILEILGIQKTILMCNSPINSHRLCHLSEVGRLASTKNCLSSGSMLIGWVEGSSEFFLMKLPCLLYKGS